MRQVLSTALVALIVGALAGVTASTLAQTPDEQTRTVNPAAVSNINAHRVDGKHAVGFTNKKLKRRYKLVATDKHGFLPSNIVKPFWGAIKNKPAGFADGVDNGITNTVIYDGPGVINAGATVAFSGFVVPSPNVLVTVEPTTPGAQVGINDYGVYHDGSAWRVRGNFTNYSGVNSTVVFRAVNFGTAFNGPTPAGVRVARSIDPSSRFRSR